MEPVRNASDAPSDSESENVNSDKRANLNGNAKRIEKEIVNASESPIGSVHKTNRAAMYAKRQSKCLPI